MTAVTAAQRRVVVTGAGRGLGRALATGFIEGGAAVWGTSRGDQPLPGAAGHLRLDLQDEASIKAAADAFRAETDGLDLLVNCAGTDARAFGADENTRGPFDIDPEVFGAVLQVNTTGPMLTTRAFVDLLRAGQGPMIVNVTSQLGSLQVASRKGRDIAYGASKAALNLVSVRTATALADDGIGVVMLHPGWINTDMGGPSAEFDLPAIARTIVTTIEALTLEDSGRFIRWDGYDHPW
ncbi:MAG: SDR family NAD(P)-dependent oxidoreductase [Actinomycetota bacterium]